MRAGGDGGVEVRGWRRVLQDDRVEFEPERAAAQQRLLVLLDRLRLRVGLLHRLIRHRRRRTTDDLPLPFLRLLDHNRNRHDLLRDIDGLLPVWSDAVLVVVVDGNCVTDAVVFARKEL